MLRKALFLASAAFFLFLIFFGFSSSAFAASISFSPVSKNVVVGKTATIDVVVSSADQAMNAASGDISFPTNEIRVVSISFTDSVVGFWVRNPSFTNGPDVGNVHFEGILPSPGFVGVNGILLHITFQAVGKGNTPITFSDGVVLANDGRGTNILTSLGAAAINVSPAPALPPPSKSQTSTASGSVASNTTPQASPKAEPQQFEELVVTLLVLLLVAVGIIYFAIRHSMERLEDDIKKIDKP